MDVQKILFDKLDRLPIGNHTNGLKAVRFHIEVAVRHLSRGQADADESAFTDAIYRCNQAFEGSIKEAYRVLAGKPAEKKTPAEIEEFLLTSGLLRTRVLDQFRNYRTEWRNPSTHDYMLRFDENEALLAIVSVSVFAIVLCDQIDGKLAFRSAVAETPAHNVPTEISGDLLDMLAEKIRDFSAQYTVPLNPSVSPRHTYIQLEGALGGYLATEFSKISSVKVEQNAQIGPYEADLVVSRQQDKIAIEIKLVRNAASARLAFERAILQTSHYLVLEEIVGSIILFFCPNESDYLVVSGQSALPGRLKIVTVREVAAMLSL